jgi:hypothetical protein
VAVRNWPAIPTGIGSKCGSARVNGNVAPKILTAPSGAIGGRERHDHHRRL